MSRFTVAFLAAAFVGLPGCTSHPIDPTATAELTRSGDAPAAGLLEGTGGSAGAVRTTWPSDNDPGAPFYARIDPQAPHVPHDGQWAAVVFYRDPACVRPDFNLIDFFDVPAAFGCDPVVNGTSIWANGPGVGSPRVAMQTGTAVPVWFFPAAALLAELDDGAITIGELAAASGRLVGTATHFQETLMPHALPAAMGGGGHPHPGITITASGTLEDGRSFQFQFRRDDRAVHSVRIAFR
jgi:hypothetical protein